MTENWKVGEIFIVSWGFGNERFIVKSVYKGIAVMKMLGSDTWITSNEQRKFIRTGITKNWWEFWK